jgi:GNAT superfamily N-acetyltransferase
VRFARIPFELTGGAPRRPNRDPEGITWAAADEDELTGLMLAAFSETQDPRDAAAIDCYGAKAVTSAMIADAVGGDTYSCDRRWWSVVLVDDTPAGFVLPVVFVGEARGDLDEGTIYHIGVIPQQRGKGLGALLLARGTNALLSHGVWRICADTAVENEPMIRIFERQGWHRRESVIVPLHPPPGLDRTSHDCRRPGALGHPFATGGTAEPLTRGCAKR